jgi:hypothetical protein
MTGQPYGGFRFAGHAFNAPAGTSITSIRWGGRLARNACYWGTFMRAIPSGAKVLGLANGEHCTQTDFDITNYPISYPVPPGTTRLEQMVICGATTCDPGAAMHSHSLEVMIDDPQPPSISLSGRMVSGQWVSGRSGSAPDIRVAATDSSGIKRTEAALGSQHSTQSVDCNWSLPRPCPFEVATSNVPGIADLTDGRHTLSASAEDAAGNSATATRDVYVDNTPPEPVVPEIIGGSGWRRSNGFGVSWANPPNNAAPITRAHWKLCTANGTCPTSGQRAGDAIDRLDDIRAPGPGEYNLGVWLEDAAGNQREANAALSVPIRFDPEPPELAFTPVDAADPLTVRASAVDRHSGIATGEIEIRASGSSTWHGLQTVVQGSELVAYVDDERFRRGLYEFRAHAVDRAGNETSTEHRADGATASLRLPARIETRLAVGTRGPRGPRRQRRLNNNVLARYGRSIRLAGHLANADGQPIEGASVEAFERRPGEPLLAIGFATTSREGRFRYSLSANRNREVLFRYGGSRRIGTATALFHLRVPATGSLTASRRIVRNGESVLFSGRVRTRPLPADGKLLEMQAYFRGRWRTFSTLRSDKSGRWRFRYRFGATLGRVTYRFRVRLPSEAGYPFAIGKSSVAKVVVLGPR